MWMTALSHQGVWMRAFVCAWMRAFVCVCVAVAEHMQADASAWSSLRTLAQTEELRADQQAQKTCWRRGDGLCLLSAASLNCCWFFFFGLCVSSRSAVCAARHFVWSPCAKLESNRELFNKCSFSSNTQISRYYQVFRPLSWMIEGSSAAVFWWRSFIFSE